LTGLLIFSLDAMAQQPVIRNLQNFGNRGGIGRRMSNTGQTDSLSHRNKFEDSITISFRYLDSARNFKLDSSITDFTRYFPVPATNIYLGNIGNASEPVLFSPHFNAGWDPGFHSFDVYKWLLDKSRFFNTTRPYSELNYMLGSRVEQIIEVLHTRNIKPNWNALFQYRMINSPGFFKNQKSNHNNYLLTSWYQSKKKRYNNYFVILSNNLQSGESGGMMQDQDYLGNPVYKDRFNIPTEIGGDPQFGRDFFSTVITTGNKYNEFTALLRQQYDLGRKDSLVTDSTVVPLFFPRVRFEHTISYSSDRYTFQDLPNSGATVYYPDSAYYFNNYGYKFANDTVLFRDVWKNLQNDFSIYQFPDEKNLQQFFRVGATVQNLHGVFSSGSKSYLNIFGHAEYRNKTKNLKWDVEANGKLYFVGLNAGDYEAYGSLQRYAGKKIGYVQLGFQNVNRTPSFIYDSLSSFYLMPAGINFKKENNSQFFASIFQPEFKMRLSGHYYLMTNYTYITDYYKLQQQSALFNLLQIALQKTLKFGKHWNWHADIYFQQVIGNSPVNVPLIFTRNRIAYEGNLGFKNLDLAFGTEIRYHTPYKADGYSPALGQFFTQDSIRISDKTPDIDLYLHFRIRPFKAFVRIENLNTLSKSGTFTNNNLVAPGYAFPGLQIRLGIFWGFVN
jgi:hypothetical protein